MEKYKPWLDQPKGQYWCQIGQTFFNEDEMVATHIVLARVAPELMDYVFGAGAGSLKDTVQNALFINSRAEKAFDKGMFVIIPVDPTEQPRITRYKIVLTGVGHKLVNIGFERLGECDGRELVFKTDFRPVQRSTTMEWKHAEDSIHCDDRLRRSAKELGALGVRKAGRVADSQL
jgi:hypothetical protein